MIFRFNSLVLFVITLSLGYLSFRIMQPFIIPIAWAVSLAIVFYPLYLFFFRYLKSTVTSSLATLAVIIGIIIGPFSYFLYLLAIELSHMLSELQAGGLEGLFQSASDSRVAVALNKMLNYFGIDQVEAYTSASNSLKDALKNLAVGLSTGVGNVFSIGLDFVIMIFILFFFLKDGSAIMKAASEYMPFSADQKKKLTKQVKDIVISTLYGSVIVAMVQGVLGGVAYWLLGVPSPVLWGMLTSIAAFLPLVGAFVVWGPVAAYLFIQSGPVYGIIMVVTGVFAISMMDNLLRPLLIGGRTRMPVLVIFFSVLGGIKLFGLIGFIAGPLVIALFMSIVNMFRNIQHEVV
ncbi:MAG: AI-2E family transporter [Nitrospiraceae bacterium]|nr:AI-2E family transporter [Nitrospiraceae bacterium]